MEDRSGGEYLGDIPLIARLCRDLYALVIGRSECSFTHTYPHSKVEELRELGPLEELVCLILSNR